VLAQAAGFALLAALSPTALLTSRRLTAFNAWLLAHGRALLVMALLVAGAAPRRERALRAYPRYLTAGWPLLAGLRSGHVTINLNSA